MNRPFSLKMVAWTIFAWSFVLTPAISLAQTPVISWISTGVRGRETFLICGDGFQSGKTEVLGWVPKQPAAAEWSQPKIQEASLQKGLETIPPPTPPGAAQRLAVVEQSTTTLAAQSRNSKINGAQAMVQVIWVRTPDGTSTPVIVNKPMIWWSTPEFPAPGSRLRLFGRNMNCTYGAGRAAILRGPGGKRTAVEWGVTCQNNGAVMPAYEFELKLPSNLPAGKYELYLHNGSGGDFGWSEPHVINVRRRLARPNKIVKAADYGAVADNNADDSEAIQRAMDDLSKGSGGAVQLGPGTFLLKDTLHVPAGVTLRGAGEQATRLAVLTETPGNPQITNAAGKGRLGSPGKNPLPLVTLANQCGLERLTLQGGRNTICTWIGGKGEAHQISIRNVNFVNYDPVWQPYGKYRFTGNCVAVKGPINGLQIVNSRFEGEKPFFGLPGLVRRAIIQGNYFQSYPPGRSDLFTLRDPVECLVENNIFTEGWRGIVVQPQPPAGMAVHNVFANNTIEHIHARSNAGEMELWEVGGSKTFEVVRAAGSNFLSADHTQWKSNALSGLLCLILDGHGFGQYRLVKENSETKLTVDRPWKVIPAAGARFVVTPAAVENLILNDTDRDGDAALQFWGTCIGNVVAGEVMSDTQGAILYGQDLKNRAADQVEIKPCWFNDFRLCRFYQGAHLALNAASKPSKEYADAPPLVFGNAIRESAFSEGPRLPHENKWTAFWEWPNTIKKISPFDTPGWEAAITLSGSLGFRSDPDAPLWNTLKPRNSFNLVERNFVEHWPVGIYQALSATNNILVGNQIMAARTKVAIVGKSNR